ncbi:MAG: hypothetical protein ACRC5H_09030 [Treponemataceae bacterium]
MKKSFIVSIMLITSFVLFMSCDNASNSGVDIWTKLTQENAVTEIKKYVDGFYKGSYTSVFGLTIDFYFYVEGDKVGSDSTEEDAKKNAVLITDFLKDSGDNYELFTNGGSKLRDIENGVEVIYTKK